jgi:C4-type Zn-finger protein
VRPNAAAGAQTATCPKCNAPLAFFRSYIPHIDECGFESYSLECKECGAGLAGVIDPADETLLLSETAG